MLEELFVELIDKGYLDVNANNGNLEYILEKYKKKWNIKLINRYIHKGLGIIGVEKEDGHLHY